MEADILIGLALFAFVSSITPGPNNAMLMASGANFGLARSLSHMFGVGLGFMLMVLVVGVGVIQLLNRYPLIDDALTVICVVYLLYLAYRIATAANVQ
ncbi:MAG: LysE family transporter, partial [Pseudomonadota bacterium]